MSGDSNEKFSKLLDILEELGWSYSCLEAEDSEHIGLLVAVPDGQELVSVLESMGAEVNEDTVVLDNDSEKTVH